MNPALVLLGAAVADPERRDEDVCAPPLLRDVQPVPPTAGHSDPGAADRALESRASATRCRTSRADRRWKQLNEIRVVRRARARCDRPARRPGLGPRALRRRSARAAHPRARPPPRRPPAISSTACQTWMCLCGSRTSAKHELIIDCGEEDLVRVEHYLKANEDRPLRLTLDKDETDKQINANARTSARRGDSTTRSRR